MQSIGERLEEARKRKGISIREAAEATKIRSEYLSKFESNQYDIRLPEIYVRGFLRSYSSFLKLPADKIIADYNAISHGEPKANRGVNREIYGRMEISSASKDAKNAKETPQPQQPAAASAAGHAEPLASEGAAAQRSPATFAPPRASGIGNIALDKKLLIKAGAVLAVTIVVIILIIVLFSGRGATPPPRAQSAAETWIHAQAGEPTITLIAKSTPVTVTVSAQPAQQGGAPTIYYQGTIPAGESRVLPRRSALYIETDQYKELGFIIDGIRRSMPEQRTGYIGAPQQ